VKLARRSRGEGGEQAVAISNQVQC
jgi:hypothetical protein